MEAKIVLKELNIENIKSMIKQKNIKQYMDNSLESLLKNKEFYKKLGISYGIIYNFDYVQFDKIDDLTIDFKNIIEARFFNQSMEIDIRIDEDRIEGSIFVDEGEKELCIEEYFFLRSNKYKKLKVKEYINFDEDNQGYVFYMKPCELLKEA